MTFDKMHADILRHFPQATEICVINNDQYQAMKFSADEISAGSETLLSFLAGHVVKGRDCPTSPLTSHLNLICTEGDTWVSQDVLEDAVILTTSTPGVTVHLLSRRLPSLRFNNIPASVQTSNSWMKPSPVGVSVFGCTPSCQLCWKYTYDNHRQVSAWPDTFYPIVKGTAQMKLRNIKHQCSKPYTVHLIVSLHNPGGTLLGMTGAFTKVHKSQATMEAEERNLAVKFSLGRGQKRGRDSRSDCGATPLLLS